MDRVRYGLAAPSSRAGGADSDDGMNTFRHPDRSAPCLSVRYVVGNQDTSFRLSFSNATETEFRQTFSPCYRFTIVELNFTIPFHCGLGVA